jgi:hypothetical protein
MARSALSLARHRGTAFSMLRGEEEVEIPGSEWSDWDSVGRLVFARSGRLYTTSLDAFPDNQSFVFALRKIRSDGFV